MNDSEMRARAVIDRIYTISQTNPLNDDERIKVWKRRDKEYWGGVMLDLSFGGVRISQLRALTRGGGRLFLAEICKQADVCRAPINLTAVPSRTADGFRMTQKRLIAWYAEFGFIYDERWTSPRNLIRYPR